MKIDILTLFPEMFTGFLNESIIGRAREKKQVEINIHNFRDYSMDKHKKVDDTPYGGVAWSDSVELRDMPRYYRLRTVLPRRSRNFPNGRCPSRSQARTFPFFRYRFTTISRTPVI